jgi:hypothetical protein
MKLLCVSNTITVSKGFFNREKVTELVKGITVGKKYEGQIVPIVDRYTWSEHQTTISADDMRFMLYNDDGEWKYYPLEYFKPVGG